MTKSKDQKFRRLCRQYMKLSVEERIRRGFCLEKRRVPGDRTNRSFATMEDYRRWCEENLPEHLGFRRVVKPDDKSKPTTTQ